MNDPSKRKRGLVAPSVAQYATRQSLPGVHYTQLDDVGNRIERPGLPPNVTEAQLEKVRERAAKLRKKLAHKPTLEELCTPQEIADGAPFYFQLTAFLHDCKQARLAAGLTLKVVAKKTGLTVETLSRLETGKITNPTWKTIGTYAVAVEGALTLSFKKKR